MARRTAFSLIELLVVIAIISLLISILTPSLSRARQQAKATVCLSTMHEFMKGLVAYGSDYSFALPPARFESAPDSGYYHGWAEALYRSLYNADDVPLDHDFPVMANQGDRYKLWVCKENAKLFETSGHFRVYDVAWAAGSLEGINHRLPLLTDANPAVTDPEDVRRSDIPRLHIAGLEGEAYIDERHYGGANYAFNDGHAERSTRLKEDLALDWDLNPKTPNR
jgi:prepilin-type N-terminal cleavage/methylation domain-containing protein/prepilin-type processing-associated H-X9-DG protein